MAHLYVRQKTPMKKILLSLLLCVSAHATEKWRLDWGTTSFFLHVADDHQPAQEQFINLAIAGTPKRNEFICAFQTDKFYRYLIVQGFSATKEVYATQSEFAKGKRDIKATIEKGGGNALSKSEDLLDRIEKAASLASGEDTILRVGVPIMFPVFSESANHISYQTIARVHVSTPQGNKEYVSLLSSTVVSIKGKWIFLLHNDVFRDRRSYSIQQEEVNHLVNLILRDNKE
jgi:hypothetical protein